MDALKHPLDVGRWCPEPKIPGMPLGQRQLVHVHVLPAVDALGGGRRVARDAPVPAVNPVEQCTTPVIQTLLLPTSVTVSLGVALDRHVVPETWLTRRPPT
jgi:hypothetical protein